MQSIVEEPKICNCYIVDVLLCEMKDVPTIYSVNNTKYVGISIVFYVFLLLCMYS